MSDVATTDRGDRVGYDRRGEGDTILFVAGAGPYREIDAETTAVAELLAGRGFTAVVHDRVGRAESHRPGPVSLDDELAALDALLRANGGRGTLCGHSSGAAIALRAAAAGLPVDAVVMFEAPLDPSVADTGPWIRTVYDLLDAGNPEGAIEHYMKDIPLEVLDGLRESGLWAPFVTHAESLRADAEALEWGLAALGSDELAAVTVPVLLVVGEDTFDEMPRAAAALAEALPNARRATVAGAQHAWEPESMADLVADFLGGRRPPRPTPHR